MANSLPHKGEGHRARLRERFLSSGLEGFHDYEVIELLLTLGTPRKDCKQQAKAVLAQFKTLPSVFEAPQTELERVGGLGPKNTFGLKLIKAVSDRYLQNKIIDANPIQNSKEVFDYLNHVLRDRQRECFLVIYLDAKNKIKETETLFEGSLTSSVVYPREVVTSALNHHAAALIFAHNHPSGDPKPSPEDLAITRQLVFACRVMGITVHEHLIVGQENYYSFSDQGHIAQMNQEFNNI